MNPLARLMGHALDTSLLDPRDVDYAWNRLMRTLNMSLALLKPQKIMQEESLESLIKAALLYAGKNADDAVLAEEIMDCFTPPPSQIQKNFDGAKDGRTATKYFYRLSQAANIIKTESLRRNRHFSHNTEYGTLDVTINLAKPEKTPTSIMRDANRSHKDDAPPCMLCKEHVGRQGEDASNSRANHRIVIMDLNGEPFFMQYSPYQYYQEHAIIIHHNHQPMHITKKTFLRLCDFVSRFPDYFLGSNADLPIVGGSMLSHEHYQGGGGKFPIDEATVSKRVLCDGVTFEKLVWPMPSIRIKSSDKETIARIGIGLLKYWQRYENKALDIIAKTDVSHNTITPIMRKTGNQFVLTVMLRNNHTTLSREDGQFHIHPSRYYVKKENIGLIEAMGRAILPARIAHAMDAAMEGKTPLKNEATQRFFEAKSNGNDPLKAIHAHIGEVFKEALEDCAVFKNDAAGIKAFDDFFASIVHAYETGAMA